MERFSVTRVDICFVQFFLPYVQTYVFGIADESGSGGLKSDDNGNDEGGKEKSTRDGTFVSSSPARSGRSSLSRAREGMFILLVGRNFRQTRKLYPPREESRSPTALLRAQPANRSVGRILPACRVTPDRGRRISGARGDRGCLLRQLRRSGSRMRPGRSRER